MTELSEIMRDLDIKANETQTYFPYSTQSGNNSNCSSDASSKKKECGDDATIQRLKPNEFLCASSKQPVKVAKKSGST